MIFSILLPKFKPKWDNILNQIDDEIHHLVLNDLGVGLLSDGHLDVSDSCTPMQRTPINSKLTTPIPRRKQKICDPEIDPEEICKIKEQTLKSERKNRDLLTKLDDYESELEKLRIIIEKLTHGSEEKDTYIEDLQYQISEKDCRIKDLEKTRIETLVVKKNTDKDEEEYRELIDKYNEQ